MFVDNDSDSEPAKEDEDLDNLVKGLNYFANFTSAVPLNREMRLKDQLRI